MGLVQRVDADPAESLRFLGGGDHGLLARIAQGLRLLGGGDRELLAQALFDLTQLGLMMAAVVVLACVAVPPLIAVLPPLMYAFVKHKRFVGKSMTELKRMEAARDGAGPVFSPAAASLSVASLAPPAASPRRAPRIKSHAPTCRRSSRH